MRSSSESFSTKLQKSHLFQYKTVQRRFLKKSSNYMGVYIKMVNLSGDMLRMREKISIFAR